MEFNQAVAQRIKQLLKDRNFTQYALFKYSAVPCSTLSMICSCKVKDIRLSTVLNICRGLDMPLKEFFNDKLFDFENLSDDAPDDGAELLPGRSMR